MNQFFLLLVALNLATGLSAQSNKELDEHTLLSVITTSPDDSNKVEGLRELAEYYLGLKTDTSLLLARQALDLSVKVKYQKGKVKSEFTLGKIFVYIGNYSRGLELYLQSLESSKRIREPEWGVFNLTNIGEIYSYQADYKQALMYFLEGSTIARNNRLNSALAELLVNIGQVYESLGQMDSADFYIQKSYQLATQYNDNEYLVGKILYSLGELYSRAGNISKAMEFYKLAMSASGKVEDFKVFCNSSLGIARLFNQQENSDSAIFYARQSLHMAVRADFLLQRVNAVNFLAQYYKQKKMFDSAFVYLETAMVLKDSLISKEKIKEFQNISFSEKVRQLETEQSAVQYRNKIKTVILLGSLSVVALVAIVLWRNVRLKQRANILLTAQKLEIDKQKEKVEESYRELKSAQAQLIQSEKMASLGELTAGIAHEIQNPLNFINNFSEVSRELLDEMKIELENSNKNEAADLADNVKLNLDKILTHGKRADAIVKGMLQHSRSHSGVKEPTYINALADEYLRLAYHGLRAKDKSFNATFKTEFDEHVGKVKVISQDIARVILNLVTNAFYAVAEKKKNSLLNPKGSTENPDAEYEPTVIIQTSRNKIPGSGEAAVTISIKDNGNGIPQKALDKIFQPFFTTKPTGQGTGLGLSLSYDIVKAHGGEIKVATTEGKGAEFTIVLPVT